MKRYEVELSFHDWVEVEAESCEEAKDAARDTVTFWADDLNVDHVTELGEVEEDE